MKQPSLKTILLISAFVLGLLQPNNANAATQYFKFGSGADNNWNTTALDWASSSGGTYCSPWTNGNNAVFETTGGTVNVGSGVAVGTITFNTTGCTLNLGANSLSTGGALGATANGFTLTGNSTSSILTLGTASTYSGGITVNSGGLTLGNATGAGSGAITLNAGALNVNSGITAANNLVVSNGNTAAAVMGVSGTSVGLMSGSLTGAGTFNIAYSANASSTAPCLLPNVSAFTGTLGVDVTRANVFPQLRSASGAGSLTLNITGGTSGGFVYNDASSGGTFSIGALTGNGRLASAYNVSNTYAIGGLNTSTTFSGVLVNNTFAGTTALTKVGTGTLTLSGANTYTGATTVSNGTLIVSTLATGGGAFTVKDGATLGVTINGPLMPMSALTLGNSTGATMQFSNFPGAATAPVNATSLTTAGTVTLAISSSGQALGVGQYPLIKYSGTIGGAGFGGFALGSLPAGVTATLVNNTGNGSVDLSVSASPWPSFLNQTPAAGATQVMRSSPIGLQIIPGSVSLNTNSVALFVDGVKVTPTVTVNGSVITVNYQPTSLFALGSQHTNLVIVADTSANYATNTWSFTVFQPFVRIMPVGDSITRGQPVIGGYRVPLANLLAGLNYSVQYVGSCNVNNPAGTTTYMNEGHGSGTVGGVDAIMPGALDNVDDPDVILLLLGTNDYGIMHDYSTNPVAKLDALITHLATNRPNTKFVVSTLLPRTDNSTYSNAVITYYNPYVPGVVAAHKAAGQQVYFIDLYSVFTNNASYIASHANLLSDGIHPTALGYNIMATNWLNSMTNLFGSLGSTNAPAINHVVGMGNLTNLQVVFSKPVDETTAQNAGNYSLSGGLSISAASLNTTHRIVTLTTSPQTANAGYTLTVSNVTDITVAANAIVPGTTAAFTASAARGATNNVAEAAHFQMAYSLDIPNTPNYSSGITYTVDNHATLGAYGRMAYYLELQSTNGGPVKYIWASMNPISGDLTKIGVPTVASGAMFQQALTNMNVASSVVGIVTGTGLTGGNLQFWPTDYSNDTNTGVFDWNNARLGTGNYGSMKIANTNASQMLFSFNAWGGKGTVADLGIGNNRFYNLAYAQDDAHLYSTLTAINPDWTFRTNADSYAVKTLQVFIQPVPVAATWNLNAIYGANATLPTGSLTNAAGNPANYALSVTAVSTTSTNGSAVSLGGDLSTITYTPTKVGQDQFTYTLSDGHGGTATGTVMILINNIAFGPQAPSINTTTYGTPTLFFAGIPGYNYSILRSTNVNFVPLVVIWTTNLDAGGSGVFQYTDTTPPTPQAFYRLRFNP